MEEIEKIIIEFIRDEIGEFKLPIFKSTLIEDDLGVTGDEAISLISKIAKMYEIDITGLDFSKYFHPEPNFFQSYKEVKPFTINDILNGIRTKKIT